MQIPNELCQGCIGDELRHAILAQADAGLTGDLNPPQSLPVDPHLAEPGPDFS